jgi:hypothetical protein
MVWEDMCSGSPAPGSQWDELRFIRNFVSHGGVLGDLNLLAFLNREFGKPVNHYDPHDPEHQAFLEGRRDWARKLVETEIEQHL